MATDMTTNRDWTVAEDPKIEPNEVWLLDTPAWFPVVDANDVKSLILDAITKILVFTWYGCS